MAKSIRQLILENIETTLAGVTTAAGYNTTFKAAQINRSAIGLGRENVWPTILIGVSDLPSTVSTSMSGDEVARELTVDLILGLGGNVSVMPTEVEEAVADIIKAMAVDTTRGGNACVTNDPEIREPTYSQVIDGHAFVTLSYVINYVHKRTDATLP